MSVFSKTFEKPACTAVCRVFEYGTSTDAAFRQRTPGRFSFFQYTPDPFASTPITSPLLNILLLTLQQILKHFQLQIQLRYFNTLGQFLLFLSGRISLILLGRNFVLLAEHMHNLTILNVVDIADLFVVDFGGGLVAE